MLDRAQKRGRCSDLISRVSTLNLEFNRWLAAVIYLLQGSTTEVWANNGDERISFHPQKKKMETREERLDVNSGTEGLAAAAWETYEYNSAWRDLRTGAP